MSADNLCKQLTKCRAWSGAKLFDTLIVLKKSSCIIWLIWPFELIGPDQQTSCALDCHNLLIHPFKYMYLYILVAH